MRLSAAPKSLKFSFKSESREEVGWLKMQSVPKAGDVPLSGTKSPFLWQLAQAWTTAFIPLPEQWDAGNDADPSIKISEERKSRGVFMSRGLTQRLEAADGDYQSGCRY